MANAENQGPTRKSSKTRTLDTQDYLEVACSGLQVHSLASGGCCFGRVRSEVAPQPVRRQHRHAALALRLRNDTGVSANVAEQAQL